MVTVQTHVSYEAIGDHKDELEAREMLKKKYNVDFKVVQWDGPGGGNPVCEISGEHQNVRECLIEWYAGGNQKMGEDQFKHGMRLQVA